MELPTDAGANSSLGQASSARGQTLPSSGRNPRPAPRGMASYQRRRAVKACQVCRARRTKCDNLKPSCSFCLKTGATCVQSPVDLSSFDPASLKILERLDDLEGLLRPASLDPSDEPLHKRPAQEPESRRDAETTPTPVHMSMVLPGTVDEMLHWPCFQDLQPPGQQFPSSPPARRDQPGPLLQSPASILGGLDLEPVRVNDLLNRFFSYVHVKNPILDERATRRTVKSTILNGADWSPESCLSFLICALGSIATPFGPSHDTMPGTPAYSNAVSLFQAAQKRIGVLLFSDDIIAPQCLFLSGVFAMCIFQPVKAWRFFMQALAHCQQLDFLSKAAQQQHSYPKSPDGPCIQSPDLDSLHQAVYWSAWKSEREMRGYLHLTDFSPNDHGVNLYPAFFPTPPVPRVEDDVAPMDVDQQREQTSWYFYLAEISLRRLAARIGDEIEVMQRAHPTRLAFLHAVALAIPAYEAQIREWIDSLPPRLSFAAPAEHDDVCRFVLRGHAINFFEMLYWPFLSAYLDTSALDATTLAPFSDLAQKALDHHVLRLTVNEPGYRHRHHGTYPMMQSCSRSALALVAAAAYNRPILLGGAGRGRCCPLTLPLGWIQSVSTLIGLLDFWSPEVGSLDVIRRLLERGLLAVMN